MQVQFLPGKNLGMVPDGDGRALPPEVGLEDKTFHRNKQELGEGHDVPTSWELPAGMERQKSNTGIDKKGAAAPDLHPGEALLRVYPPGFAQKPAEVLSSNISQEELLSEVRK